MRAYSAQIRYFRKHRDPRARHQPSLSRVLPNGEARLSQTGIGKMSHSSRSGIMCRQDQAQQQRHCFIARLLMSSPSILDRKTFIDVRKARTWEHLPATDYPPKWIELYPAHYDSLANGFIVEDRKQFAWNF